MHSDDSDTDSSASDADNTTANIIKPNTDANQANRSYLCVICDQHTNEPVFNEVQSCLQCPDCKRSWCLLDNFNKKKCSNLDLIPKRYLEIKFSQSKHRKHDHHMTKHALHWIGTNILGNLGNIDDTLTQVNLARNFDDPTLESLRAQQRFGIHHPNLLKYHPTHPIIIASLPKLDIKDNKTHQLLLKENVCPICQIEFIDNGLESSDDDLDELLSSDNDEDISTNLTRNDNESKEEQDMFTIMDKSTKLKGNINTNTKHIMNGNDKAKTEQIGNVVNLYSKQTETVNKSINIGNELIASPQNSVGLHETMNLTVNNNENMESNDSLIVNEWTPVNIECKTEENVEDIEDDLNENENKTDKTFKFEIQQCEADKIDQFNIVRLWCGHIFHNDCVIPWLSKQNTCPLCRYELPSNNPSYELKRRVETYDHDGIYQVMT